MPKQASVAAVLSLLLAGCGSAVFLVTAPASAQEPSMPPGEGDAQAVAEIARYLESLEKLGFAGQPLPEVPDREERGAEELAALAGSYMLAAEERGEAGAITGGGWATRDGRVGDSRPVAVEMGEDGAVRLAIGAEAGLVAVRAGEER